MRPLRIPLPTAALERDVCWRCTRQLVRQTSRAFSRTSRPAASTAIGRPPPLQDRYFLYNSIISRLNGSQAAGKGAATPSSSSSIPDAPPPLNLPSDLPHRRRQAARRNASSAATDPAPDDTCNLPTNASTILTEVAARHDPHSVRRTVSALLSLSKPRLTVLVVLTAMAPYALYPVPSFLAPSVLASAAAAPSLSPVTLLFLTAGTALCSASANALNMLYELSTDAKMSRTRNRPLVRNLVSRRPALAFAVVAGAAGTLALHLGVNPTVSALGAANIALYAGVYTPLKRVSVLNTWAGGLVGAIPPLMGWAAAAGESATGDGGFAELLLAPDGSSAGGWLFAGLLFAWQFPHFMALSWSVRDEYRAAGLRMLAWVNPARNARVALRYSLVMLPLAVGLCAAGVTEWSFAATSLPVNLWLVRQAVLFWRYEGAKGSARGLFWASVWHLPVFLVLALLQKKGMWARVWRSVAGAPDDEDEDDWEEESVEEKTVVP